MEDQLTVLQTAVISIAHCAEDAHTKEQTVSDQSGKHQNGSDNLHYSCGDNPPHMNTHLFSRPEHDLHSTGTMQNHLNAKNEIHLIHTTKKSGALCGHCFFRDDMKKNASALEALVA